MHDFALTLVFFTLISFFTAILAGSFAANLLHDVYTERRQQYATLIALGFSPLQGIAPGLAFGLVMALSSTIAGSALAISFGPSHFSMPSLMADLGTVEPRFDLCVAAAAGMAAAAVILGVAPTAWRLFRQPIAAAISATGR